MVLKVGQTIVSYFDIQTQQLENNTVLFYDIFIRDCCMLNIFSQKFKLVFV